MSHYILTIPTKIGQAFARGRVGVEMNQPMPMNVLPLLMYFCMCYEDVTYSS
jgi:hypothetical protein